MFLLRLHAPRSRQWPFARPEYADAAAALPISHTEGEAITLTVTASHEATLTWQTDGSYDFYLVEWDGAAIARTLQKEYIDHTSIGSVTYRVRGCYADSDNYGVSNSDTVEVLPETNMICDLETGVWLEMRLSETQLRTNRTSFSAGVSTVHLAGLAYPIEERSEQRDRALSVACAWLMKVSGRTSPRALLKDLSATRRLAPSMSMATTITT